MATSSFLASGGSNRAVALTSGEMGGEEARFFHWQGFFSGVEVF